MEKKTWKKKILIVSLMFLMALLFVFGKTNKVDAKYKFTIKGGTVYAKIGKKLVIDPVIRDKSGRIVKSKLVKNHLIINKKKYSVDWGERSNWYGGLVTEGICKKKLVIKKFKLHQCYNGPNKHYFNFHISGKNGRVAKIAVFKVVATNIKKHIHRPKMKVGKLLQKAKRSFTVCAEMKKTKNNNTENVSGLNIQYSKNKSFKNSKVVKTKYFEKRIRGVKNGKYYVRVKGYGIYNGKKYYGKWSKKKSIEVK